MSIEPYSAQVRALFDDPAHVGVLDGEANASIDAQGVRVQLFARVAAERIRALRFRAWGCPHVIAAAEAFCASYENRPVADLGTFSASELMQSLPIPMEKTGRILVIEDVVHALAAQLRVSSNSMTEEG